MKKLEEDERIVSMHYADLNTLLEREDYMTSRLLDILEQNGNEQYISDQYISIGKDMFILNYILSPTKT